MAEPITVCNEENGCYSTLFHRNCPIADRMLQLIQCSVVEKMNPQDPNDELFKVYQYCEELRAMNKEYWDDQIREANACWEAVPDDPHPDDARNGRFWRVRWSAPDSKGRWFYVRHYGGNGKLNQYMAEREAKLMNELGRHPSEWMPDGEFDR